MPTISMFYGVAITMNYSDHNPPHFHATYQDYEVSVEIKTGSVNGTMSKRALKMIFEWADLHKDELLNDWDLARERRSLLKIDPLSWGVVMFLHVKEARYIRDYKLELTFNNSETKTVDLENELYGEVFEPLKDKKVFSSFFVSHNTVEWSNGADFAPEFLYEKTVCVDI